MVNRMKEDELRRDFKFVEKVAWLMDDKYVIPGTRFRFGLDPIINLFPFVGDVIGYAISMSLVMIMWKNGVSGKVIIKMILNVFVDAILGGIPFLGKILDFTFKANARNVRLLRSHYFDGKHQGSGVGILIFILSLLLILTIIFMVIVWKFCTWAFSLIGL